jgi:GAF domain-containing protein
VYAAWGATGKVRELDRAYPFLHAVSSPRHAGSTERNDAVSSDAIDLLAVLRASQALSAETNLGRLRTRVVEILSAMTGATGVRVVFWNDDAQVWFLPSRAGEGDAPMSVDEAGRLGLLPLSAFRYAERTREPLLVEDATRDDRFARDPYLAGVDHCSLLVVPILARGTPRAMLVLENRLIRSALFGRPARRRDAHRRAAGGLARQRARRAVPVAGAAIVRRDPGV